VRRKYAHLELTNLWGYPSMTDLYLRSFYENKYACP
jgi:hypothetical protein